MRNKRLLRLGAIAALALAALLADSRWRIVTSEYEVTSDKLPAAFDGFRVVQLSDIHGASFGEDNRRLTAAVEAAEPDIIAITGDLADENTDMEVIDSLLAALAETAPVYYVSGNHEWAAGLMGSLGGLFEKHGVRYLRNEHVTLERDGESITVAGVEDPNALRDMPKPEEVLAETDPESFTLLLAHRNYWAERYTELDADAVLCGHAHGGIIRLPFLGGVLGTGRSLFPGHTAGMETVGSCAVIISRGIGNSVPVPRFLNNPEIVVLTLRSGG